MSFKRLILSLLATASVTCIAGGETLAQLKEMAKEGITSIETDCIVEGWWLGDYANPNLDNTAPRHYSSDHSSTVRYVNYLQSVDGEVGVKLNAAHKDSFRDMPRYAWTRLNLKGCSLEWMGQEKLEISGVEDYNIIYIQRKTRADVPVKRKYISELIPSDIYTLVTLRECEFPLKDGTFLNIYEKYSVKTPVNKDSSPNGAMNSWARMVTDSRGDRMYLLINSTALWRKEGGNVPRGSGDIEGILVSSTLPRYGGAVLGRYQLRPLAYEDIRLTEPSQWKELTGWDLLTEPKGNVSATKGNLITINTPACEWWDWEKDCGKGIILSINTTQAKESLILAFSFSAGKISAASSAGFPVYWEVQVSANGAQWTTLRGTHRLCSMPWWYKNNVDGSNYLLSYEAGLGPTEHMVKLPKSLLGLEKAYIRIRPAKKIAASHAMEGSDNAALRPNLTTPTWVNFGAIAIYSK